MKFPWHRLYDEEDGEIHQPRMKVFTVGLDEKEKTKNLDEKLEAGSMIGEPKTAAQISPPVPPKKLHKGPFKTWLSCLLAVFFVLIIALTLSEIAYNRHRDDQYLRLKWAELKQRMLGMEILRQSQIQAQQNALNYPQINPTQSLSNDMPPEVIDERLAFSKRLEKESNGVETNRVDNSVETKENEDHTGDVRLAFLKAILDKIRTAASNGDLPSPVHVSVLEIKKPLIGENEEDIEEMPQNMADGFGEWAAPSQFGPADFQENEGPQFDRFTWRNRLPQQNSGEAQPWMFNDDGPMDEPMEGRNDRPQLRITHHFDRENAVMPARIVTELYGDDASEFVRNFMNGRRAEVNEPPVQQTLQFPMSEPQPWMAPQMAQQPTPDQQRFAAEFGQTFGTNFGLNWERAQQQKQMPWQFQPQQSFAQPQPMNVWQQWQNQWQSQQPQPAIQPAQPQNQQQPADFQQQMPWYQNWIQENKQQLPVIDGTVDQKPEKDDKVDEEPKFTDLNEEDQGDDGFERKEQFNIPTDVIVDEQPEVIENDKNDEPIPTVVNNQPAAAIEVEPIQESESSAAFLPPRDTFDDPPPPKQNDGKLKDKPSIPAEAISNDDSFTVDRNSPFFQIDDPSSFVAKA